MNISNMKGLNFHLSIHRVVILNYTCKYVNFMQTYCNLGLNLINLPILYNIKKYTCMKLIQGYLL